MGCDWYRFCTAVGTGRVIETTRGATESGECIYIFTRSHLERDEDGNWNGLVDRYQESVSADEESDSADEPCVAVVFDSPPMLSSIEVPGPYEIRVNKVTIKVCPDGHVIISSTQSIWFWED
jgi:hypothetical protein